MSGRLSAPAVIEGSLTAVFEDDSSDDESDCGPPSTIKDNGEFSKDDQQEELEVFVLPKATLSSHDNGTKMTDTKSETSLASALAASVRMVESLGKAEAIKINSQIDKLPQLSQASLSPKSDTPEGLIIYHYVEVTI
jgi:hypothetical protein